MFNIALATYTIGVLVTAFGGIIAGVIAAILTLLAGLLGLGWGVRKFKQKISGKKF